MASAPGAGNRRNFFYNKLKMKIKSKNHRECEHGNKQQYGNYQG